MTRAVAVQRWRQNALQESFWREALDLADLLHPETLLSALKQQTAREMKVPVDGLSLDCSWKEPTSRGRSLRLTGIQLEGAIWDGRQLQTCTENSPPTITIPALYLAWVQQVRGCSSLPVQ